MRYCRIRPGDIPDTSTANTNALIFHGAGVSNFPVPTATSIIFDHVSMGTANDDTFGGMARAHNRSLSPFSTRSCRRACGPTMAPPALRTRRMASAATDRMRSATCKMSWLHNLIISYSKRCPIIAGGRHQIVNNLCQFIGAGEGMHFAAQFAPMEANVVNNSFRATASDQAKISLLGCGYASWGETDGDRNCNTAYENASNIYMHGNIHNFNRPSAASGSETAMVHVYPGTNILNTKVQSTTPVAGMPDHCLPNRRECRASGHLGQCGRDVSPARWL